MGLTRHVRISCDREGCSKGRYYPYREKTFCDEECRKKHKKETGIDPRNHREGDTEYYPDFKIIDIKNKRRVCEVYCVTRNSEGVPVEVWTEPGNKQLFNYDQDDLQFQMIDKMTNNEKHLRC